jgi:hypothetical protein
MPFGQETWSQPVLWHVALLIPPAALVGRRVDGLGAMACCQHVVIGDDVGIVYVCMR